MNVEIGTDAAQFPEKEDINGIFWAVWNRKLSEFRPPIHSAEEKNARNSFPWTSEPTFYYNF